MRVNLAATRSVSGEELAALGASRGAAISTELTTVGQVPPERVRIGARKDVNARDGAWISAELGVGGASD